MIKIEDNELELIDHESRLLKSWDSFRRADFSEIELQGQTYEKELEEFDISTLERFSFFNTFEDERFKRLQTFLDLCRSDTSCCSIEETTQNQFHRETIIFSNQREFAERAQLSRGLLDLILNKGDSFTFPINSFTQQLQKDIASLNTLRKMEQLKITLPTIPFVSPYNSISDLVYLYQLNIIPDETSWSTYVESAFMHLLLYNGFIPIATRVDFRGLNSVILLPKMHKIRCCMRPTDIVVTKKVLRIAKKLRITLNTAFHQVLRGIVEMHGQNWVYPEMQLEFLKMHYLNEDHSLGDSTDHPGPRVSRGRLVSVEVWRDEDLVSGEIGFVNGSVYTSITGFHTINNSGNFQLVALAAILHFNGFGLWDLGMHLPYKTAMGARCISRNDFMMQLTELKAQKAKFEIPEKYADDASGVQLVKDLVAVLPARKPAEETIIEAD